MKYKKPVVWVSAICLVLVSVVAVSLMSNGKEQFDEPPTIYAYYEYGVVPMILGPYSWDGLEPSQDPTYPIEWNYTNLISYNENKGHRNANIIFSLDNDPDGWNSDNIDWNSEDFDIVEIIRYKDGVEDFSKTMQGGNWIDVSLEDKSSYIYEFKFEFEDGNYAYYSVQINNNMGLSNDRLPLPFVTIQADDKLHEPRYYENGFKFTYDELPVIALSKESAEFPINYADEFDDTAYWGINTYYDNGQVMSESFDVEIGSNKINKLHITDGRSDVVPSLDFNADYAICWIKANEKEEAEYVFKVEFNLEETFSVAKIELDEEIPFVISKELVDAIIFDGMVKSSAFEGQDLGTLENYYAIKQYKDGEPEHYYIYLLDNKPVIQFGQSGQYTSLSENLYDELEKAFEGEQSYEFTPKVTSPILMAEDSVGDVIILDYADDEKVVFHGYFGLFVYDLRKENITLAVDLNQAVGTNILQGAESVNVVVDGDGKNIMLWSDAMRTDEDLLDTMYIDITSGDYEVKEYEAFYESSPSNLSGSPRFSGETISELTYTLDEKEYLLFDGVKLY